MIHPNGKKSTTFFWVVVLFSIGSVGEWGCAAQRNFQEASTQPRLATAYTLPPGEVELGLEAMGQNPENLGARLGASVGFPKRGEAGVNLAHAAFGAANIYGKYRLIDTKFAALGVGAGFIYLDTKRVWLLSEKRKQKYGDIHIIAVPIHAVGSFPLSNWLLVNLMVGYNHAEVWGTLATKSVFVSGALGGRQLFLRPSINFLISQKVHIFLRWRIPLIYRTRVKATAEYELDPGVTLGVRSVEWSKKEVPVMASYVVVGFDVKTGDHLRWLFYVTFNGAFSRTGLISSPAVPGGGLYWTF